MPQADEDTDLKALAQTTPAFKALGARKCHPSRAALPRPARFSAPRPIRKALTAGQVTVVFLRLLAHAVVAEQAAVATAPLPGWPTPAAHTVAAAAADTAAGKTTGSTAETATDNTDNTAADTARPAEETVAAPAAVDASSPPAAPTTTAVPFAASAAAADTEAVITSFDQDAAQTDTHTDTAAVAGTWQPAPEAEADVCDACLSDTCGGLAHTESIVSQASHASIDLASSCGSSSLASEASSDLGSATVSTDLGAVSSSSLAAALGTDTAPLPSSSCTCAACSSASRVGRVWTLRAAPDSNSKVAGYLETTDEVFTPDATPYTRSAASSVGQAYRIASDAHQASSTSSNQDRTTGALTPQATTGAGNYSVSPRGANATSTNQTHITVPSWARPLRAFSMERFYDRFYGRSAEDLKLTENGMARICDYTRDLMSTERCTEEEAMWKVSLCVCVCVLEMRMHASTA